MRSYSDNIVEPQQISKEIGEITQLQNSLILTQFDELKSRFNVTIGLLALSIMLNIAAVSTLVNELIK